jgi:aarF domain-containing kinase
MLLLLLLCVLFLFIAVGVWCTEFDYREEAKNLQLIRDAIEPKWGSLVTIPRPHASLCSKHVLVMEYLEGVKLVDGIRAQFREMARRTGTTLEKMEEERMQAIKSGKYNFQTIEESKNERYWQQWYCTLSNYVFNPANLCKLCYNCSVFRLVTGPYEIERLQLPIHVGNTLELLCKVHGNEIFEHGRHVGCYVSYRYIVN